MAQFNFKIYYRLGTLNRVADTLSRKSELRDKGYLEPHNAILRENLDKSLEYS